LGKWGSDRRRGSGEWGMGRRRARRKQVGHDVV
jgi:hypothetical protein